MKIKCILLIFIELVSMCMCVLVVLKVFEIEIFTEKVVERWYKYAGFRVKCCLNYCFNCQFRNFEGDGGGLIYLVLKWHYTSFIALISMPKTVPFTSRRLKLLLQVYYVFYILECGRALVFVLTFKQ